MLIWHYGARLALPPGWARPSQLGQEQLCPQAGPGPALQLQGSARANCSGQTSPLPAGASSGRSSAAPTPKAVAGWGRAPSPGEQGKVDVAGERHVDCNLAAGRTFLSEGPRSGRGCPGKGALQILIANALKGVIAVEVVSAHVVSRAGVADPTQADRSELALWRREMLERTALAPLSA